VFVHTPSITDNTLRIGGHRPEFFRLPITGHDPYFGLTRPFYYDLHRRGLIRLKQLRKPGKLRGVTLVPFQDVKTFLQREVSHE
jgi:hypothetical protein